MHIELSEHAISDFHCISIRGDDIEFFLLLIIDGMISTIYDIIVLIRGFKKNTWTNVCIKN